MLFEIKSLYDGSVLFSLECRSLKLCVEAAVNAGATLARANLAGANLAGANLAGADLAGADLAGANIVGADLAGANLARAYLAEANLAGANLAGADLAGANIVGADLAGATLARADLAGAYLSGANIAGAYLVGAYLAEANLAGAKWRGGIVLRRAPIQLYGLEDGWTVTILDEHMEIGCELHTFAQWQKFKDSRIKLMDDRACAFWKRYRPALLALCATREVEAKEEEAA